MAKKNKDIYAKSNSPALNKDKKSEVLGAVPKEAPQDAKIVDGKVVIIEKQNDSDKVGVELETPNNAPNVNVESEKDEIGITNPPEEKSSQNSFNGEIRVSKKKNSEEKVYDTFYLKEETIELIYEYTTSRAKKGKKKRIGKTDMNKSEFIDFCVKETVKRLVIDEE